MEMYAYNESYLEDSRDNLGEMFDYAINVHGMKADDFWDMFAHSNVAECLSCGDPKYVVGMSGTEAFAQMIYESTRKMIELKDLSDMDRSREYWAGWALAYYQWYTNTSYTAIHRSGIKLSDIVDLYVLHEAPDEKFIEAMREHIGSDHIGSVLKRLRIYAGLTQRQLSEETGVSLRMIQLYEQGQNDISRAQAHVVISLARALGCEAGELISG